MKKRRLALLLITAVTLMNAVPCYAGSQSMAIKIGSSENQKYTSLPSAETVKKDTGFTPKLTGTLAGEFTFESGNITEMYDVDDNGSASKSQKGISFKYASTKNGVSKSVTLSAEPAADQTLSDNPTIIKYGEFSLYYNNTQANSIAWTDGDVFYILMDINKKVTKDELTAMAKGLIDIK